MPIKSSERIAIPEVSVPSFVFGSPREPLPDEPIILDAAAPDILHLTLSTYRSWSMKLAARLQDVGLDKGDRVLYIAGNSIAYPIVLMGTLMAGGILSGASPTSSVAKITHQAIEIEPTIIVTAESASNIALNVANNIGLPHDQVFVFDTECFCKTDTERSPGNRLLLNNQDFLFDWPSMVQPGDMAVINFTSGSSGDAKGVLVSHRNFVANAAQYIKQQEKNPFGPENIKGAVWVMWTPMYHVIGQNQYCIIAPKRGLRNYIMDHFDLEMLLCYAEKYRATELILLPPIVIALLHHPALKKYDLSSVTVAICGGSPIRESTIKTFENLMPNPAFTMVQGWGMTEMTCLGINASPVPKDRGTIGQIMPNCEAKIMTLDSKHELGVNEPGELWIRGPNVAQRYWKRPELTASTYRQDGWLRTGDFGYYNEDHRWFIRDRVKDVIQTPQGAYILPTDLESILLSIPGVEDAGVTSFPSDDAIGSYPCAFVVLAKSGVHSVQQIERPLSAALKKHEHLTGGLFALEEIPRLPSGKVDRVALRQLRLNVDGVVDSNN